jgi:hypothetical protein
MKAYNRPVLALLTAVLLAQTSAIAKVVEDTEYQFRADFPGAPPDTTKEYKLEDFKGKDGRLSWRTYTSGSPASETASTYSATVKVFETDTTDVKVLFAAGESDAVQVVSLPLIGRADGTFGAEKLPSMTLTYQGGEGAPGGPTKGKVLLVAKGTRLYEVAFHFSGSDQTAVGEKFFRSFEILK